MCGTGFGFSVEEKEVNKLPIIPEIKSGQGNAKIIIDEFYKYSIAYEEV